jgi:hypothetical protein
MNSFAIVEIDRGFTVVEVPAGQSPEDVAISEGGILVDPGPYDSYEEAIDALDELEEEEEDH